MAKTQERVQAKAKKVAEQASQQRPPEQKEEEARQERVLIVGGEHTAPKIAYRKFLTTVTYQVGVWESAEGHRLDGVVRITENATGFFNKAGTCTAKWIPMSLIDGILHTIESGLEFSSEPFRPLFDGGENDNTGFLVAVLRQEGILDESMVGVHPEVLKMVKVTSDRIEQAQLLGVKVGFSRPSVLGEKRIADWLGTIIPKWEKRKKAEEKKPKAPLEDGLRYEDAAQSDFVLRADEIRGTPKAATSRDQKNSKASSVAVKDDAPAQTEVTKRPAIRSSGPKRSP